jgi:FkbM family methyltransferase
LQAGARQVVAVEPNPAALAALYWNLRCEIAENRVFVFGKGAWSAVDSLPFTVDPHRPGRSSLIPGVTGFDITIEVEPIDHLINGLELPRIDFIKMDIEGAELQALQGARETLRHFRPQLAVAVEHTDDLLRNARMVKNLVVDIDPSYHCEAGSYRIENYRLVPEILYFRRKRG